MLLNNQWTIEQAKKEIKNDLQINENENTMIQNMACSKSSSTREVKSDTNLPQEIRKISNNLMLYLKQLEKKRNKTS